MENLALQIRQRDRIIVDDADLADSGGGEILEQRRAETSGSDDEDACGFQLVLAGSTDTVQHDVARITLDFFRGQHLGNLERDVEERDEEKWNGARVFRRNHVQADCVNSSANPTLTLWHRSR
jgi:hypothetical protein